MDNDAPVIITRFTLLDGLRDSCPAFHPEIDAYLARYDTDELPHYMLMGDLVIACSRLLAAGRADQLEPLFALVERWIAKGDKYVSDLAVVGFIEDLQNGNLHSGTRPEDFLPFLGPRSRRAWDKADAFWTKRQPITRD